MKTITACQIKLFLLFSYFLVLAFLAGYDQPLFASAHKLLQRPTKTVAESTNAYYYLIGLNFPSASEPAAEGRAVVGWYRTTLLKEKQFADFYQYPPEYEKKRSVLRVKGSVPRFYEDDKHSGMLEFAADNPQKLQELLRNNELLLSRYCSLLTYRQYHEPLELGIWMPLPGSSASLELHRLYLLSLGQQAHQGNLAAAVNGVQQTMEFWLAMASADTSLMMKFQAFSALRNNLYLAAELAGHPGIRPEQRQVLAKVLQFDTGKLHAVDVLRSEAIWAERTTATFRMLAKNSCNPVDWLLLAWLKPNTMMNQLYAQYMHDNQLAKLSAPALVEYMQKHGGIDPIQVRKFDLSFIYSPLGEAQAVKSYALQYSGYARKVHDLEGIRRLCLLKLQAHEHGITASSVPEYLAHTGADLANPYTGKPMVWYPDRKSIGFMSHGMEKLVELRLF